MIEAFQPPEIKYVVIRIGKGGENFSPTRIYSTELYPDAREQAEAEASRLATRNCSVTFYVARLVSEARLDAPIAPVTRLD